MTTKIIESVGDDPKLSRRDTALVTKLDRAVAALEQKQNEFAEYLNELKAREEEVKNLKDQLYAAMTLEGVKKLENDRLLLTVVQPSVRKTVDTKKLQAVQPLLYKQVMDVAGKETKYSG